MNPPAYLYGRITNRIRAEKKLAAARKKAAYFFFALAGSAVAFFVTFVALEGALVQSEIFRILSLIVSDPRTVAADWANFSSFFLESLPIVYLALFLASIFVLLESLKYASKYANETFSLLKVAKK